MSPPAAPLPWVLSARDARHGQELRLSPQAPLRADPDPAAHARAPVRLWVDRSRRFQALEGFGGAFTEAAASTWLKLSSGQREALLRAYFDPAQGHGYSLCRVHMNSCDFALGNYAHVEQHDDHALEIVFVTHEEAVRARSVGVGRARAGRGVGLVVAEDARGL
mgnify:CR=1 FL=1